MKNKRHRRHATHGNLRGKRLQISQNMISVIMASTIAAGGFSMEVFVKAIENKNMNEQLAVENIDKLIGKEGITSESKEEYKVEVKCGENGTVLPYEEQIVKKGEDLTLEFIPDDGYEVNIVDLNGIKISLDDLIYNENNNYEYTIENIENDFIIHIEFKQKEQEEDLYIDSQASSTFMASEVASNNLITPRAAVTTVKSGFIYEKLKYDLKSDNTATLIEPEGDTSDTRPTGDIRIPETISYNGTDYTVKEIRSGAFKNCSATSIHIPKGVTTISVGSNGPFNNSSSMQSITVDPENTKYASEDGILYGINESRVKTSIVCYPRAKTETTFKIPETVTSIGSYAFYYSELTSAEIPSSVTTIGSHAFYYSKLTSAEIPGSVTTISSYAFRGCSNLGKVTFSEGLKTISSYAFLNCTKLTNVTIPASVQAISYGAFGDSGASMKISVNSNNQKYVSDDGILYGINASKEKVSILYCPKDYKGENGEFTIPTTVTSIDSYTFYKCASLISIDLPAGVTSIGSYAFYKCASLTYYTP